MDAGEGRLREQGAPKVTALVGRGDTQAEGLWRAAGYKDDVEIGRWVRSLGVTPSSLHWPLAVATGA